MSHRGSSSFAENWSWSSDFAGFDAGDAFARVPRERPARTERPDRTNGGTTSTPSSPSSNTYVSGDPTVDNDAEYNIQINFLGTWSTALKQAFISAADAISDFILGDVADAGTRRNAVDDLVITASMINIDGAGGILGQAGPDAVRAGSYLPYRGSMEFDVADANAYQAAGLFDDIVLHEMLHTVGFGTIWGNLGRVSGSGFNGPLANAVYTSTAMIPVETDGGAGTAYAHWDDATFGNELMTGYIDGNNDLSYMTIASLGDLGYNVVSGANYSSPTFI